MSQPKEEAKKKEELIANVKEWLKLDADIVRLKADIKEKTSRKKALSENLVQVMKQNAIDCFDFNGGALVYKQRKTKRGISGKFLLAQLEEYYRDQPALAKDIAKTVLENRPEVIKDEIKKK